MAGAPAKRFAWCQNFHRPNEDLGLNAGYLPGVAPLLLTNPALLVFFTNNAYGNKECSSLLCRFLYP
jgi:hypothetical protein